MFKANLLIDYPPHLLQIFWVKTMDCPGFFGETDNLVAVRRVQNSDFLNIKQKLYQLAGLLVSLKLMMVHMRGSYRKTHVIMSQV